MSYRYWVLAIGFTALSACQSGTNTGNSKITSQSVLAECKANLAKQDKQATSKECMLAELWIEREQPDSLQHAEALEALGDFSADFNASTALANYQAALDLREKLTDKTAALPALQLKLSKALVSVGKWDQAETLLKKLLETTKQSKGKDSLETADILNRIGIAQLQQKNLTSAESYLKDALSLRESKHADPVILAESYNNLGYFNQLQNKTTEAEAFYQKAIQAEESAKETPYTTQFDTLSNLAVLVQSKSKDSSAEWQKALGVAEKGFGSDSPQYALILNYLGISAIANKNYTSAASLFGQSLQIREKKFGLNNLQTAESAYNLGIAQANLGNANEALKLIRYAASFTQITLGASNPLAQQRWNALLTLEASSRPATQNAATASTAKPAKK